jgi:hypothetical protein
VALGDYWRSSRQARYSLTFVLPLFVLYEVLAALLSQSAVISVRNGADVMLKTLFVALGGSDGVVLFGGLLLGLGAWAVWRDASRHPGPLRVRILGLMLVESAAYALVFGTVVSTLTVLLLSTPLAAWTQGTFGELSLRTQLVVSLGAGLYEELLFRVALVSGLVALGRWLGWTRGAATAAAVVASALIFSGFHYVGPLGDPLTLASFTYRAIAGGLLSGLYAARGFGITAWTHTLYDIGIALAN